MSKEEAKRFPLQVWTAIPVSKNDLWFERVKWKFCEMLMRESLERQQKAELPTELKLKITSAVGRCLALFTAALTSNVWDDSAAWSAAESADSVRSAADSAWSAAFDHYASELIKLLGE